MAVTAYKDEVCIGRQGYGSAGMSNRRPVFLIDNMGKRRSLLSSNKGFIALVAVTVAAVAEVEKGGHVHI